MSSKDGRRSGDGGRGRTPRDGAGDARRGGNGDARRGGPRGGDGDQTGARRVRGDPARVRLSAVPGADEGDGDRLGGGGHVCGPCSVAMVLRGGGLPALAGLVCYLL